MKRKRKEGWRSEEKENRMGEKGEGGKGGMEE